MIQPRILLLSISLAHTTRRYNTKGPANSKKSPMRQLLLHRHRHRNPPRKPGGHRPSLRVLFILLASIFIFMSFTCAKACGKTFQSCNGFTNHNKRCNAYQAEIIEHHTNRRRIVNERNAAAMEARSQQLASSPAPQRAQTNRTIRSGNNVSAVSCVEQPFELLIISSFILFI